MIPLPVVNGEPPVRVMALHALAYCPRLFYLEEVEETCNRVIWMERGRMVMEGDDVTGIIDQYIAASGGQPVMRDPETGSCAADSRREYA